MRNQAKPFLKNAVLLTIILGVIIFFMPEWGVAQIIIVLLVALLTGGQWALWAYMRKGR
jgi:MFS superfamily sulfate permease-like transporter